MTTFVFDEEFVFFGNFLYILILIGGRILKIGQLRVIRLLVDREIEVLFYL